MARAHEKPDFTVSHAVASMAKRISEQHNRIADYCEENHTLRKEVESLQKERIRLEQELQQSSN